MPHTHLAIYPALIMLLFAARVSAQDTSRTAGFYGKIKTITDYNYATEGGDNGIDASERAFKVIQVFDETGNRTEEYRYGADGLLIAKVMYKYHSLSGRLIEERNYDASVKYKYSDIHHYDPRGNEIMRKSFKSDKTLFLKVAMEYDEQNNILQEKTSSPGGRVLSRAFWKYDSRNNPIEETTFDPDQGQTRKTIYKYDDRNYLIEEKSTYYDLTVRTTYTWDSTGRLISEVNYNAQQRPEKKIKHIYNQQGDEIEQYVYTGDDLLLRTLTFTYTYDNHSNLLKRIQTENNREIILVQREIAYY